MGLKRLRLSTLIVSIALVGSGAILLSTGLRHGYAWSDMDWNLDGVTSASELIAASDIGVRWTEYGDLRCKEYFSLKDGLPLRTICPVDEAAALQDKAQAPR
ncbi:hypothetical protein [Lysobacter sp. Root690]|uniref:hypothetical protein n=1 Tax=Lysobacter sp. Root690 TaxID=1736588 RepID=UPI000701C207|nr:hypothetical protein [Lysobacter sp. Root690]KRB04279.1 hypothetical protein ASD86_18310 [Lysobacter sp. Root690]